MKRITLILITTVYLLSCVGMGINRFYCCGKLASVTLIYGAADNHNTTSAKNKCCKHENQSLKIKDSHVNAVSLTFSHPQPVLLPVSANFADISFTKKHPLNISYQSNAPPGHTDVPIYSRNCAYRI